jgi:hypothetical protein
MNSTRNGLGMRKAGDRGEAGQPENPHSNAVFTQVHDTLYCLRTGTLRPGPFFLHLFTEVPAREILGSSSRQASVDGIML